MSTRPKQIYVPYWITSPVYAYAEFQRIGRYLMGQNVHFAEMFTRRYAKPEDDEEVAYRLLFPDTPHESAYNIFSYGTVYTDSNLPDNFSGEIRTIIIEKDNSQYLLHRLKRVGRLINERLPHLHSGLEIGQRIKDIEICYETEEVEDFQSSSNSLAQRAQNKVGHAKSFEGLIDSAEQVFNAAISDAHDLRIQGSAAQKTVAVLTYFMLHPQREIFPDLLKEIKIPSSHEFSLLGGITVTPPMALGYYLVHPNFSSPKDFITAKGAGRFLRQHGKEASVAAMSSNSITEFHSNLYLALLYYRGAHEVYSTLKNIGQEVPTLWNSFGLNESEMHTYWIEAEEARVGILTGLADCAAPRLHGWNPARPLECFARSTMMASRFSPDETEAKLRDLSVQYLVPKFVTELLIAAALLSSDRVSEVWKHRTIQIADRLESVFDRHVMLGEPNYLSFACTLAANYSEKLGNTAESAKYRALRASLGVRAKAVYAGEIPLS